MDSNNINVNELLEEAYETQENDERVLFIRDAAIRLRCVHIIGIPDRDCWAAAERLWAAKPENC